MGCRINYKVELKVSQLPIETQFMNFLPLSSTIASNYVSHIGEISSGNILICSFYKCHKSKPLIEIYPVYDDHNHPS